MQQSRLFIPGVWMMNWKLNYSHDYKRISPETYVKRKDIIIFTSLNKMLRKYHIQNDQKCICFSNYNDNKLINSSSSNSQTVVNKQICWLDLKYKYCCWYNNNVCVGSQIVRPILYEQNISMDVSRK